VLVGEAAGGREGELLVELKMATGVVVRGGERAAGEVVEDALIDLPGIDGRN
jgi:hypothetical protein